MFYSVCIIKGLENNQPIASKITRVHRSLYPEAASEHRKLTSCCLVKVKVAKHALEMARFLCWNRGFLFSNVSYPLVYQKGFHFPFLNLSLSCCCTVSLSYRCLVTFTSTLTALCEFDCFLLDLGISSPLLWWTFLMSRLPCWRFSGHAFVGCRLIMVSLWTVVSRVGSNMATSYKISQMGIWGYLKDKRMLRNEYVCSLMLCWSRNPRLDKVLVPITPRTRALFDRMP